MSMISLIDLRSLNQKGYCHTDFSTTKAIADTDFSTRKDIANTDFDFELCLEDFPPIAGKTSPTTAREQRCSSLQTQLETVQRKVQSLEASQSARDDMLAMKNAHIAALQSTTKNQESKCQLGMEPCMYIGHVVGNGTSSHSSMKCNIKLTNNYAAMLTFYPRPILGQT